MAIGDINLTAGMRSNLVSLQSTANLLDRTQQRLSTGLRVNSPIDDPVNYFAAEGHRNRAGDISLLKDGMNEAIQTVKAADAGIKGITSLIASAKGIIQSARSADTAGRAALQSQFNNIRTQIDQLAKDSGYKGINLLTGGDLAVKVGEDTASTLTISGFDAQVAGDITITAATAWGTGDTATQNGVLDTASAELDTALADLRTNASSLSANTGILTARLEFSSNMINTLTVGADKLTLADTNEEGANMLMLQTRQQLGVTSLSLASQAAQSVLRLF